jgi:hypothetical protein
MTNAATIMNSIASSPTIMSNTTARRLVRGR